MWSFKYTGTPTAVAAAVASDPTPVDPRDAAQHTRFQQVIGVYLSTLPMPTGHNAITIIIRGDVTDVHTQLQLTLSTLKLEL